MPDISVPALNTNTIRTYLVRILHLRYKTTCFPWKNEGSETTLATHRTTHQGPRQRTRRRSTCRHGHAWIGRKAKAIGQECEKPCEKQGFSAEWAGTELLGVFQMFLKSSKGAFCAFHTPKIQRMEASSNHYRSDGDEPISGLVCWLPSGQDLVPPKGPWSAKLITRSDKFLCIAEKYSTNGHSYPISPIVLSLWILTLSQQVGPQPCGRHNDPMSTGHRKDRYLSAVL
jgi:hypothetical protein